MCDLWGVSLKQWSMSFSTFLPLINNNLPWFNLSWSLTTRFSNSSLQWQSHTFEGQLINNKLSSDLNASWPTYVRMTTFIRLTSTHFTSVTNITPKQSLTRKPYINLAVGFTQSDKPNQHNSPFLNTIFVSNVKW